MSPSVSRRRVAAAALTLALAAATAACSGSETKATPGTTDTTAAVETTTTTEVPLESGTQISVYNPSVGDCIDRRKLVDPKSKRTSTITLKLDCNLPHSFEVFAVVTYPAPTPTTRPTTSTTPTTTRRTTTGTGTSSTSSTTSTAPPTTLANGGTIAPNGYPGEDAVRRFAKLECAKAFEPYVGRSYEVSSLELGYLLPTEDDWPGRRIVACWLRTADDDGKLVGSKRGSGE